MTEARAALEGLIAHLREAGLGSVTEVFSGDILTPGGCAFQTWSVAELLRSQVLVCHAETLQASRQPSYSNTRRSRQPSATSVSTPPGTSSVFRPSSAPPRWV